jgi:hypothetical protein
VLCMLNAYSDVLCCHCLEVPAPNEEICAARLPCLQVCGAIANHHQ